MRLIYRQTMVQEIRAVIAEAVSSGRMMEEIDAVSVTQPEWDRLEVEFGKMAIPWSDEHRILTFGVPVRKAV